MTRHELLVRLRCAHLKLSHSDSSWSCSSGQGLGSRGRWEVRAEYSRTTIRLLIVTILTTLLYYSSALHKTYDGRSEK